VKYSNRLRVLRADRRITQLDLALKAKLSQNRYWRIENGYDEPSDSEKKRIARVLKADVSEAFPEAVAS
jgi:transcriptional regulator with XRE-family HTH domain